MSSKDQLLAKRDALLAIPEDNVDTARRMPIATYIHEAEALYNWCRDDRAAFQRITGIWHLVEDIPIRSQALRELESMWRKEQNTPDQASQQWKDQSPALFQLRKNLLSAFRYAFREDKFLLRRVSDIAKGNTNAERLQNLNDLAVLGRDNKKLLKKIRFNLAQLDEAAAKAAEMSEVLAIATNRRKEVSQTKKLRDRAYTHLKEAVDEVYCAGRYLLRRNSQRLKGYSSVYLKQQRNKSANPTDQVTSPTLAPTMEPVMEPAVKPAVESAIDPVWNHHWNQPWNPRGTSPPIEKDAADAA